MNEELNNYEEEIILPKEKEESEIVIEQKVIKESELIKEEKNPTEESKQKKKTKINSFFKAISKTPKIIKKILGIAILVLIFVLGITFSEVMEGSTKTTKFGLEDRGELVTQTAHLTIIKDSKESRDFFQLFTIPFTESRKIFSYDFEVDASVEFSKIETIEKKEHIIVKLPHAKIYKITRITESLNVYLDEESWFSNINLQEENTAFKEMEEQAAADALANGLLEAADRNAQKLIEENIRKDKKYKDYEITFEYIGG